MTLETSAAAGAEHRIDAATERIEVVFDRLEQAGHLFKSPRSSDFSKAQVATDQQGGETCRVELLSVPPLTSDELRSLALRVAVLLSELPDVTPRDVHAVDRVAGEADTDPGEEKPEVVLTREHVAKTRPEGVKRRPVPFAASDEVTEPRGREEAPTRPQDVIAIRRR